MTEYTGLTTFEHWQCSECGVPNGEHHHAFSRRHFPFVAMLRVHNEARWIEEVIRSTFQLCDHVFVLDDHSNDGTPDLCRAQADAHPHGYLKGQKTVTVFDSPFEGLNESRDKNWLYDQIIRVCAPDWILCIDGDEVLEGPAAEAIRNEISIHPEVQSWALKIEFLWNDAGTVRKDRIYGDFWRPSLFRPFHEDPGKPDSRTLLKEFRFQSTPFGRHINSDKPNLHCSSVPQRLIHGFKRIPARLKHYGYMRREWRVAKLDYYTSIDWKNDAEDWYRHMTQGDYPQLAELPRIMALMEKGILTAADINRLAIISPSDVLMHAGPLELAAWNEGGRWRMSAWANAQNGFCGVK